MPSVASALAFGLPLVARSVMGQVTAVFPNGETNPPAPFLADAGAAINQTSMARLLTLNGIDDFCLFGPPEEGPDSVIGNVEPIVVAYCLQPRNNARLIPDGTVYSAHFIKTPLYVQIQGFFDGTKINIPYGDDGGELDPHGAENLGNPIGGNVTSNVTGSDVFYEEWMSFMSYNQFCLRICTAESDDITAALQCEHELDVMGCQFVMPGDYTNNSFTSCEGEAAIAPGLYPQPDGSTSTFRQYFTGPGYTVGQLVTPTAPAAIPSTSNCVTYQTIGNGVDTASLVVPTSRASAVVGAASSSAGSMMSSAASMTSGAASSVRSGASSVASGASASASRGLASASSAAAAASSSVAPGSAGFHAVPSAGLFGGLATGAVALLFGAAVLL